jgi:hypothetical protein
MPYCLKPEEVKCRISESCFYAIGSFAKCYFEQRKRENDAGVDFLLIKSYERNGKIRNGPTILEFQIKSTIDWEIIDGHIRYSLKNKNYNDMVDRNINGEYPIILVLMCLDREEENWIQCNMESIVFKKCVYWYHNNAMERKPNEESSTTINIPVANIFNNTALVDIITNYAMNRV